MPDTMPSGVVHRPNRAVVTVALPSSPSPALMISADVLALFWAPDEHVNAALPGVSAL